MKISINEPSVFFQNLCNGISEEKKKILLCTFLSALVIGFATHLFMFVNKLPNLDDIPNFYSILDLTDQGRWFTSFAQWLGGRYSTPIVTGTISILCLALSSCIVVLALDIKKIYNAVLVSAFMTTMPSVAWTFSYMGSADAFSIGLTLACLAVYVTNKYPYGFYCGALLFAFSLGIYQLYFCFAIGLFTIIFTLDLFEKDFTLRNILTSILKITASLLLGIILYYIILRCTLNIRQITMSTYRGLNKIGSTLIIQILKILPLLIFRAVIQVKEYFFNWKSSLENTILLLASLIMFISCFKIKKIYLSFYKAFLITFCFIFTPIFVNIVCIMSLGAPMYLLMSYPLVLLYLFVVKLSEIYSLSSTKRLIFNHFNHLIQWIILFTLVLVIRSNYLFINEAYLKTYLGYEQIYSFTTRLITHIELMEDFKLDSKVILIENTSNTIVDYNSVYSLNPKNLYLLAWGLTDGQRMLTGHSYDMFVKIYLASKINVINSSEGQEPDKITLYKKYSNLLEVVNMPKYPLKGSIKNINGNIIVKLN